jgi:hypothetical protein
MIRQVNYTIESKNDVCLRLMKNKHEQDKGSIGREGTYPNMAK